MNYITAEIIHANHRTSNSTPVFRDKKRSPQYCKLSQPRAQSETLFDSREKCRPFHVRIEQWIAWHRNGPRNVFRGKINTIVLLLIVLKSILIGLEGRLRHPLSRHAHNKRERFCITDLARTIYEANCRDSVGQPPAPCIDVQSRVLGQFLLTFLAGRLSAFCQQDLKSEPPLLSDGGFFLFRRQ